MAVRVRCPKCGKTIAVPETAPAGTIECPSCHQRLKWAPKAKSAASPKPAAPRKAPAAAPAGEPLAPVRLVSSSHPGRAHPLHAKRRSPAMWIGIGTGVVVVAALVGVGAYYVGSGPEPAPKPKPNEEVAKVPAKGEGTDPDKGKAKTPPPPPPPEKALTPEALFAKVSPAVARLEVLNGYYMKTSTGSGFLVSADGMMVTNHHVIKGARRVIAQFAEGQKKYTVESILAQDEKLDLAVVKLSAKGLPFLELLPDTEVPKVGAHVYAIGSPSGLTNSFSDGLVSGIREEDGRQVIQTTAAISPGNSGGPLLDEKGRVVGVNTFKRSDETGLFRDLNFAVRSELVHDVLARARKAKPIRLAGSGGKPLDERSSADMMRALELIGDQKWLDAGAIVLDLQSKNPENPQAWLIAAYLKVRLKDYDEAMKAYQKAIELSPDEAEAHAGLGSCYLGKEQWKEAVDSLTKAVELNPEDAWAQYLFGEALLHVDRNDEALGALKKSVDLESHNPGALMSLAMAHIRLEQFSEAADAIRKAIKLSPDNALAFAYLGMTELNLGHLEKAVEACQKALRMQPGLAYAHYVLALAMVRSGQIENARQVLEQLKAADPKLAKQLGEAIQRFSGGPAQPAQEGPSIWDKQDEEAKPDE